MASFAPAALADLMSPIEALEKLDQAAAVVSSNREGHAVLQEAVAVLRKLITEATGR